MLKVSNSNSKIYDHLRLELLEMYPKWFSKKKESMKEPVTREALSEKVLYFLTFFLEKLTSLDLNDWLFNFFLCI